MKIRLVGEKINRNSIVSVAGIIENSKFSFHPEIEIIEPEKILQDPNLNNSIICCSFFSGQIPQFYSPISLLKEKTENCTLIAGGPHPSGDPESTLRAGFEYVIRGEGEISIPRFFEMLSQDGPHEDTPGLSYKNNGEIIHNPLPKLINLDDAFNYSKSINSFFPIEITRGCHYSCKFCQVSSLFGKVPRHRSVDSILSYVHKGQKYVRFISPNAFSYGSKKRGEINYEKIYHLLDAIKRVDKKIEIFFGSFPSEVRPEYVNSETVKIIKKYAANRIIAIGAQSGSNRLLGEIQRGHSTEDVLSAVEIIRSNDLKCKVDFIFGLPGENEDDLYQTFNFIKKLVAQKAEIRLHTFIPLPGTKFAGTPPGNISEKSKKLLLGLISKGHASGPWLSKDKINKSLNKYLITKQCEN